MMPSYRPVQTAIQTASWPAGSAEVRTDIRARSARRSPRTRRPDPHPLPVHRAARLSPTRNRRLERLRCPGRPGRMPSLRRQRPRTYWKKPEARRGRTSEQTTGTSSSRPEDAVAGIAEPGADEGVLVELAIQCGRQHGYIRMRLVHRAHAFRGGHQTHEFEAMCSGCLQLRDGMHGAPAGGEHRIDDKDQRRPDVIRHVAVVADGQVRLLIALHAEVAHSRLRHITDESIDHPQPRAKNRDDEHLLVELNALGAFQWRVDGNRSHA